MKITVAPTGSTAPLQTLKKSKSATGKSRCGPLVGGQKRDRVKEYMEEKFYEQFQPKRDLKSRLRKLSLDKDTLRRAQGNYRKKLPTAEPANSNSGKPKEKTKPKSEKKKRTQTKGRRQPPPKTTKEICAMVLSHVRDI
ncbi:hypothetical protein, conserved [Eimeria tenella]|uniref:Uncharacterized protein n=1 Tax=Eimeria tenella TaxID=5802 RepID=U6L175_EIMTE|nr:hypothetical protein, conserved [Eimeria tenella]CDJ41510.1 hypothetical protein, conserved [Eimeria tenella]|eukprot:XP_013232260.1 hypothetical protein, conserved [Eimeria tenella]